MNLDPDPESIEQAGRLASDLVRDMEKRLHESESPILDRRDAERGSGIPIADVIAHLRRLSAQLAFVSAFPEKDFPCVRLSNGSMSPIDLFAGPTGLGGGPWDALDWQTHPFWHEMFWHRWRSFRSVHKDDETGHVMLSIPQLMETSHKNLTDFLSYRFSGMKVWSSLTGPLAGAKSISGPPSRVGGGSAGTLTITVHSQTQNIRIHSAPNYFRTPSYFGAPSTPVAGALYPGTYAFAGDGGSLPALTWDSGVFPIPPALNPHVVAF